MRTQAGHIVIQQPDDQQVIQQRRAGLTGGAVEQRAHRFEQAARIRRGVQQCGAAHGVAETERCAAQCGDVTGKPHGIRPDEPARAPDAPGVVQQAGLKLLAHGSSPEHHALHGKHTRTRLEVRAKRALQPGVIEQYRLLCKPFGPGTWRSRQ